MVHSFLLALRSAPGSLIELTSFVSNLNSCFQIRKCTSISCCCSILPCCYCTIIRCYIISIATWALRLMAAGPPPGSRIRARSLRDWLRHLPVCLTLAGSACYVLRSRDRLPPNGRCKSRASRAVTKFARSNLLVR